MTNFPQTKAINFENNLAQLQSACRKKYSQAGAFSRNLVLIASIVAGVWTGVVFSSAYVGSGACFAVFCVLASIRDEFRDKTYANIADELEGEGFKRFIQAKNYPFSIAHIQQIYNEFAHSEPAKIFIQAAPTTRS